MKRTMAALLTAGVLMTLWPASRVRACFGDMYDGIHFHSGGVDFGTVPRRGCLVGEGTDRGVTSEYGGGWDDNEVCELSYDRDEQLREKRLAMRSSLLKKVRLYERAGRWQQALETCDATGTKLGWTGSLRDRAEVFRQTLALRRPLSPRYVSSLRSYLDAVPIEKETLPVNAEGALQNIYAEPDAGFLRAHALYQMASLNRDRRDLEEARRLYWQTLREFPRTVKREATLIMIARSALLTAVLTPEKVAEGKRALARLNQEFPKSRFRNSALRLQGRVALFEKRFSDALHLYFTANDLESVEIVRKQLSPVEQSRVRERLLAEYLRRLERAKSYYAYQINVRAVLRSHRALLPADALKFSRRLRRELDLVPPYLYVRLYHSEQRPKDFALLAKLADKLVAKHPEERLSPSVRVKLAEVYYQRRQYRKALRWASLAEQSAPFDRASYVKGASLHKLRRYRAAIAAYETLLKRDANSPLRHGTREELALLFEAVGDKGKALDQYFALGYRADVAFFLDAKMSLREIEDYLRTRPDGEVLRRDEDYSQFEAEGNIYRKHALLAYTLGIRYMREAKWRTAANWFRRVPRTTYIKFNEGRRKWESVPSPDPLTAIRDLTRLERAIALAKTENARAEAQYAYGSYFYKNGLLLLYNPPLWQGTRVVYFQIYWNEDHATWQDEADARAHIYAHDVYAYAKRICLDTANRYPRSPVAPRALYRAACASRYLASLSADWRQENKRHDHWKESMRLMKRIARQYPKHPLAHDAKKYASEFYKEATAMRQNGLYYNRF